MDYQLITTNEALAKACDLPEVTWIALDTEFVRTKTYYPELGLIQLYAQDHPVTLIDPLSITDWQPFIQLLSNQNILKIFHACSEDLEVFQRQFNLLPEPIFDTQIAAAFVGHPASSGFARLVSQYFDIQLDKTETRTNWLARPLTEKQCCYASADVYYLLPLAQQLYEKAVAQKRLAYIEQECALVREKRFRVVDPQKAYLSITHAWQLDRKALGYLQRLAAWRLKYAIERNMSLNFVVHENMLWKIAQQQPVALPQLNQLGMRRAEIRLFGHTLIEMIKAPLLPEDYPEKIVRVIELPHYKQHFKKIKSLIARQAENLDLPVGLLASTRQINQYIRWYHQQEDKQPDLITGWRQDLFEASLENMMSSPKN